MNNPKLIRKVFENLATNLNSVHQRIHGIDVHDLQLQTYALAEWDEKKFREDFTALITAIHSNCNKLALGFRVSPLPDQNCAQMMATELEDSLQQMIQVFHGLTLECGTYFISEIQHVCESIVGAAQAFVVCLRSTVSQKVEEKGEVLLTEVGKVWAVCDLSPQIPWNNLQACLKAIGKERKMIEDAQRELEEAIENESNLDSEEAEEMFDDIQPWSDQEREMLNPGLALIRTTGIIVKKIYLCIKKNGRADSAEHTSQLSDITDVIKRLSGAVDDVSMNLYSPQEVPDLIDEAGYLRAELLNTLKSIHPEEGIAHFVTEEDYDQWGEFLAKAVDHNFGKMEAAAAAKKSSEEEELNPMSLEEATEHLAGLGLETATDSSKST